CSPKRESKSHDFSRDDRSQMRWGFLYSPLALAQGGDCPLLRRVSFAVLWCAMTQTRPPVGRSALGDPNCLALSAAHQRPALSRGEAFQALAKAGTRSSLGPPMAAGALGLGPNARR